MRKKAPLPAAPVVDAAIVTEAAELISRHTPTDARLTPDEAARLRAVIGLFVKDQLVSAHRVVMGVQKWDAVQARVFSNLLNKVIPDLNASFVQQETVTRDLTQLSRDELEAIARGSAAIAVSAPTTNQEEDDADIAAELRLIEQEPQPQPKPGEPENDG